MKTTPSILVADDDHAIIHSLRLLLTNAGFDVIQANSPQEAAFLTKKKSPSLVLLDMNYSRDTTSGSEGLDLVGQLRQHNEELPIVVMTGWATVDLAVASMQKGANDFIQKPWDNNRLLSIIKAQLEISAGKKAQTRLNRENEILKDELSQGQLPIIAGSQAMQTLLKRAKQAAQSDVSILITGENGTGKTMLAQYLHQNSNRACHPFVSVNMGAIPETLFESELFGHAKGAFTDAKSKRIGRVELAEGGTLFLDEIGNLPLSQQAKLLRLLEAKQFETVGSSVSQSADVRVIAATNADLQQEVAEQGFRMDLLYRLNTVTLHLPALRDRPEDVLPLADQLIEQLGKKYNKPDVTLSQHAKAALCNYNWPGNVRELGHVMERAMIFAEESMLGADILMLQDVAVSRETPTDLQTLAGLEKQIITDRLAHFGNNANQAADSLGLSRSAFYRRLDKYQL